jgi:hypothetical protein
MASDLKNKEVIQELKDIAKKNEQGLLMPEEVVESARRTSSPLHSYFDWNDTLAAKEWRLHQARRLINVCVEYLGPEDGGQETRVFVSLREDRAEGGYRPLAKVLKNPSLREILLQDALDEMNYFKSKFKDLKELAGVFEAMAAAEKRLKKAVAA